MDFGGPRKRGRPEAYFNGNGGFKKSRPVFESFQPGVGSKSKPCTKFFSTSGCPFGEGCHFLHHVPGGYKVVSQMMNLPAEVPQSARSNPVPLSFLDGSSTPAGNSKMCKRYNTPEGCKFGDKCHFTHRESELGQLSFASHEDPRDMGHMSGRMGAPPIGLGGAADFGTSATIRISIDASLAGSVIGKSGSNSKQISCATGVKLSIRDHESDPNLRNIELEGTFDQIQQANFMVRELIANHKAAAGAHQKHSRGPGGGTNLKTKLCENFSKGCCTFGDKCHFAHGAEELRKNAI